jgi:hypothetical protein
VIRSSPMSIHTARRFPNSLDISSLLPRGSPRVDQFQ